MNEEKSALLEATYKLVLRTSTYAEFLEAWEGNDGLADGASLFPHQHQRERDGQATFERLLKQALRILEEVERIDPSDAGFSALSNSAATPTATVSAEGRLLAATDGFVERVGLNVGDRIQSLELGRHDARRLRKGLDSLAGAHPSQLLAIVRNGRPAAQRPGLLSLIAATSDTAILSVSIPEFTDALRQVAIDLFSLTDAEVAVLGLLIEGAEPQEIATSRDRSVETVRSQIKSILRKVDAHSQAELVGIFSTIPKFLAEAQNQPEREAPLERSILRESGRRLAYTMSGPKHGRAVVIFHGMIDGAKLPPATQARFDEAGFRILVPARPGFGGSDRIDDPEDAMATAAADCRMILDAEGIDDCMLVGQLGGAVYAAAAAVELGTRALAVLNLGGTIPFTSEGQREAMTRGQRVLARSYVNSPGLAIFILRAGIALVRSGREQLLLDAQFPKGSADHELLHDADTLSALRKGYHFAFDAGHQAHYVDALSILSDWSEVADQVEQPLICLHGSKDPVTPVRFVREYTNGAPNRKLIELPKCGQLVLYAHPEKVVELLTSLFDGQRQSDGGSL